MNADRPMLRKWLATALLVAASANTFAAATEHTYSFDFTNFELGAPADPVTGTVSVTFDPVVPTSGTPVDAISLIIDGHTYSASEVAFDYPFGVDTIFIYGVLNGTSVVGGTNDFFINFNVVTFGGQRLMDYAVAGGLGPFFSSTGVVRPIPEPATLVLLGAGLAGAGFSRRKRVQQRLPVAQT